MAAIRLYMTISLDGYVSGPQDNVDAPTGIDRTLHISTTGTDPVRAGLDRPRAPLLSLEKCLLKAK